MTRRNVTLGSAVVCEIAAGDPAAPGGRSAATSARSVKLLLDKEPE